MFIDGTDPNSPVYLVSPAGQSVRDTDGNSCVFSGEAIEGHESGYLVDEHGNFLFRNNAYIPSPRVEAENVGMERKKKTKQLIAIVFFAIPIVILGYLYIFGIPSDRYPNFFQKVVLFLFIFGPILCLITSIIGVVLSAKTFKTGILSKVLLVIGVIEIIVILLWAAFVIILIGGAGEL